MAVFDIKATLQSIASKLAASGYFKGGVLIGEPKNPPSGKELFASIFMRSVSVARLTLNGTVEVHLVTVRLYRDMLAEPLEAAEMDLALAVQEVTNDLLGDYDLGATIRAIDSGGSHGTPLSTEWGYDDFGGRNYRVADLNVPMIVDDSASLVA